MAIDSSIDSSYINCFRLNGPIATISFVIRRVARNGERATENLKIGAKPIFNHLGHVCDNIECILKP